MKSHRIPRHARKAALLCLALAALFGALLVFSTHASARATSQNGRHDFAAASSLTPHDETVRAKYPTHALSLRQDDTTILAFPPRSATLSRPLTVVYLHGIHGRAENGCPWLSGGSREIGWLVCPEANEHLSNDTFSWAGTVADQRAVVARAERAAQAEGADRESAGVLVGFSQGAFVALDLVHAKLGRYRGLVLIAANVQPTRAMLASAGVDRVVFAAGDLDAASEPMKRAAEQLRREGMDVRFVSLGRIGHSYQTTEKEALGDAIAWAGRST